MSLRISVCLSLNFLLAWHQTVVSVLIVFSSRCLQVDAEGFSIRPDFEAADKEDDSSSFSDDEDDDPRNLKKGYLPF